MDTKSALMVASCSLALVLGVGLLCGGPTAQAADPAAQQDDYERHQGKIQSVDVKNKKFVLAIDDARFKPMTFIINPRTTYTLDGEEAERDEVLMEGMDAIVTTRAQSPVAVSVAGTTR